MTEFSSPIICRKRGASPEGCCSGCPGMSKRIAFEEPLILDREKQFNFLLTLPLELRALIFDYLDTISIGNCIQADTRLISAANRRRSLYKSVHVSCDDVATHISQLYTSYGGRSLQHSVALACGLYEHKQGNCSPKVVERRSYLLNRGRNFSCEYGNRSIFTKLHFLHARGVTVGSLRIDWTSGRLFDRDVTSSLIRPFRKVREMEINVSSDSSQVELKQFISDLLILIECLRPSNLVLVIPFRINLETSFYESTAIQSLAMLRITSTNLTVDPTNLLKMGDTKLILPPLRLTHGTVLDFVRGLIKEWYDGKREVLNVVLEQMNSDQNPSFRDILEGYINGFSEISSVLKMIARADGERIVISEGPTIWNWG